MMEEVKEIALPLGKGGWLIPNIIYPLVRVVEIVKFSTCPGTSKWP